MIKVNKKSNAEVLRAIYNLDKKFQEENDGRSLLSNNTRALIEDCEEHSNNDEEFNRRFNAQLKAMLPDNFLTENKKNRR